MRKLTLCLFLALACVQLSAQGVVLKSQKMKSNILQKEVLYSVYLPEGFDQSKQRYPVIYLLHGYGNDETTWITDGQIESKMNQAIADSLIPPTIVIMPNGENRWYVNNKKDNFRWEDMFIDELLPYMEQKYRAESDRSKRSIWGASMGGFGAMKYALTYPGKFSSCVAFSPAIYPDQFIGDRYQVSESPLNMIRKNPFDKTTQVRYYIDCGDRDFLYWGNCNLHILMSDMNIPHEFRMRSGKHGWIYWRDGVMPALEFVAAGKSK